MSTLTSANSVFYLGVAGIFPVPQKIEGYATDDAFAFEAVQPAQAVMGVDGRMSAGYTPFMSIQTITIQADSPSMIVFEAYMAAMKTAREVFYCNGTLNICNLHELSEDKTIWDGTTFNETLRTDAIRREAENWAPSQ